MNLLFIASFVPDAHAGFAGATVMATHLEAVSSICDVTLLAFTDGSASDAGALEGHRARGIDAHAVLRPQAPLPHGIPRRAGLARRWVTGLRPLRAEAFLLRSMQQQLNAICERIRFDIVHVEDNAMAQYVLPDGAATVLIEHEVRASGDVAGERSSRPRLPERGRWLAYQRRVWRRFDRIQVFTRAMPGSLPASRQTLPPACA